MVCLRGGCVGKLRPRLQLLRTPRMPSKNCGLSCLDRQDCAGAGQIYDLARPCTISGSVRRVAHGARPERLALWVLVALLQFNEDGMRVRVTDVLARVTLGW